MKTQAKKKRRSQRQTVGQRITAGMRELEEAMRSGRPLHELFTVRNVEIPDAAVYRARQVRKTRDRLHVSQAVLARLIGVSVELVEHWEQGVCVPRGPARRLLDEINRDPDGFLSRHITTSNPRGRRKAG